MNEALAVLLFAAGGALGAAARGWLNERFATLLPWTTLAINVAGAFVFGYLTARAGGDAENAGRAALAVAGFCGGFTTFSTLAFQALVQWRDRHAGLMCLYLALTLVLGLTAAWAGLAAGG